MKLLDELTEHPTTGTGKIEVGLAGDFSEMRRQEQRKLFPDSFGCLKNIDYICTPFWYTFKTKIMIVVSTRKFREKQGEYLGMAKKGEDIVIKSRENGSFKIVPVTDDDTLMSKEDFFRKLDRSIKQLEEGKVIRKKKGQSIEDFIEDLCTM